MVRRYDTGPGRTEGLHLHIARVFPGDIGTNRLRLDHASFEALGIEEGDVVEVLGDRVAWARAAAARPEDAGLGVVRLDPDQLTRLGRAPGASVMIRGAAVLPARVVGGTVSITIGDGNVTEGAILEALQDRTVLVGDVIQIDAGHDAREGAAGVAVAGLELIAVTTASERITRAIFHVVSTEPDGPVRVVGATTIRILASGEPTS